MKIQERIEITESNKGDYKNLKECRHLIIANGVKVLLPKLETSGNVYVGENASLELPKLETSGNVYVRENASLELPKLETSGNVYVRENASLELPKLETSGNVYVSENASLELPKLETSGNIDVRENASLELPKLETSGYIDVSENASLELPKLETSGNVYVRENASLELPKLETSGNVYVSENASLELPKLETSGNVYVRENASLITGYTRNKKCKPVDNTLFIVESERTSKGVKVYKGYILRSINNGIPKKEPCYISEKEGFYAHGLTLKKSISDLNFKIVSEKLKKDPINADTLIDINHYRIVTGACEMGVKNWMDSNNMIKESYRADELLPILERTRAYGVERFKELINF